jgi:hypothetical protein
MVGLQHSCMDRRGLGAGIAVAAAVWPAAPAAASPALVVAEWCPSGSSSSAVDAAVTGLPDGTRVTFTVRGGDSTVGPTTLQSSGGRTGITVGFGEWVDSAGVEAIVRSDGDAVVDPGEQLLTGSVSRPCWSGAK